MAKYIDIETAAERLGMAVRTVRDRCIAGKLPGSRKRKGRWEIPVTADARLYQGKASKDRFTDDELMRVPLPKREEATRKLYAVTEFERFSAAHVQGGGLRSKALTMFAVKSEISESTLKRWIRLNKANGIMGLVDTRGGDHSKDEQISEEAFKLFKTIYLDNRQPSIKTCWLSVSYVNESEERGWTIPEYGSMCRLVKKQIPYPVLVLHREGAAAYDAKCAPYIETDYESIEPGQIWVGDHHQFNCLILHRGQWVRPWITAWEDMRSRTVVGHHVCVSPNQTTIMRAMKTGCEGYGPPDSVHIDNGRDYDSQMWTGETKTQRKNRKALKAGYLDEVSVTGLYAALDIDVSFAIPYHPQSKPIERWFDTLDMQFVKSIKTYCGKDSQRKPEGLNDYLKSKKAKVEAYTLESFTELVGQYIQAYNNRPHSGKGVNGQTPAAVMAARRSRRVLRNGTLELLMQVWSGVLKVGKNGVRFKGMSYGQYDHTLSTYQGKQVRVSYDPDDIRKVYVYEADSWKFITIADQAQLIQYYSSVSEDALREAMKQKAQIRKVHKQYRDTAQLRYMDLTSLVARAVQRGTVEPTTDRPAPAIRPAGTLLDGEVGKAVQRENIIKLKKAAGAEGMEGHVDLGIDLSMFQAEEEFERVDLRLFQAEEE